MKLIKVGSGIRLLNVSDYGAGYAAGAAGAIGISAPGNVDDVTAPSLSGNPYEGATVTTAPGTWYPAADSYTYAYDTSPTGTDTWTPVAGQTASTIVGTAAMEGLYLRGRVTGTNAGGTGTETPTSNALGPFIATPYFTTAPAISGTPAVDETLTCDGGTVGGGGTISRAYQWQADGVDIAGATSATYVPTATEVGADITCDVTPSNAAGTGTETSSNALGPVTGADLTAVRQGASERYLQTYVDGQITDSGSPDYAYDGTSGSTALVIEDHVLVTEAVGVPYVWDSLAGAYASGLSLVGDDVLAGRAADADDPTDAIGLTPTGGGNYATGWELPANGSGQGSAILYITTTPVGSANRYITAPSTGTGAPLYVWHKNTQINCRLLDTSAGTLLTHTHSGLTAGRRYALVAEWDPATPGSGTGTLQTAVLDLVDQTVGATQTSTYTVASTDFGAVHWIGRSLAGSDYCDVAGLAIDEIAGRVITDGTLADIADGSDPGGGLTRARSLQGYRTGVWDGSTDTLVYRSSTGTLDVVAQ